MITARVETITPEMARKLLDENRNFREERPHRVREYARLMVAKQWGVAEPINFDTTGKMINGFHRLNAVVLAGIPVEFVVVRGCEPTTVKFMDTGLVRNGGDALCAAGMITDRRCLRASLVRFLHCGATTKKYRLFGADFPLLYPIYKRAIEFVIECFPSARRGLRSAMMAAWGRAFLARPDCEGRLRIAADKLTQLRFDEGDEALRLLARYSQASASRSNVDEDYKRAANALDLWLAGKTIDKLYQCSVDPFPLPTRYTTRTGNAGAQPSDE